MEQNERLLDELNEMVETDISSVNKFLHKLKNTDKKAFQEFANFIGSIELNLETNEKYTGKRFEHIKFLKYSIFVVLIGMTGENE